MCNTTFYNLNNSRQVAGKHINHAVHALYMCSEYGLTFAYMSIRGVCSTSNLLKEITNLSCYIKYIACNLLVGRSNIREINIKLCVPLVLHKTSSGSRFEQSEEMQRNVDHFYMGQNHVLQLSDKKNGLR